MWNCPPCFQVGEAQMLNLAVGLLGELQLGHGYMQDDNAKTVALLKTLASQQPPFALLTPPHVATQRLRHVGATHQFEKDC